MQNLKKTFAIALVAGATLFASTPYAQTDDIFAFIPDGGRTLLARIFEKGVSRDDIRSVLTGKKDSPAWLGLLSEKDTYAALDEYQMQTLADYLAHNMPLAAEAVPADTKTADWLTVLPRDGRDLALEYCQSCHIITVVITQDRTKDAWLGTMNKPSHVEIDLTPEERDALADYLIVNAGIPIDLVPPELRAGGASY